VGSQGLDVRGVQQRELQPRDRRRRLERQRPGALETAARITAFLCKRTGIPPTWTQAPTHTPGVTRHYDLGRAGGNHTDPTTDVRIWRGFMAKVRAEYDRGGFRPTWGEGTLHRIDT
jgi:hypothetical protein